MNPMTTAEKATLNKMHPSVRREILIATSAGVHYMAGGRVWGVRRGDHIVSIDVADA